MGSIPMLGSKPELNVRNLLFTRVHLTDFKQKYVYAICLRSSFLSWCFGGGGTPVLIPNTEVKPATTDGTQFIGESR